MASSVPPAAPRASTSRMLFAFARRPLALTYTSAAKAAAARTSKPAGRACRATPSGRRTVRATMSSELGDTSRLLGRTHGFREGATGRGCDTGRDRALDERSVRDTDALTLGGAQLCDRGAYG